MPRKRKASKARIENLQIARETFSGKRRRSTPGSPADSDISDSDEGMASDDEIVLFYSFKTYLKLIQNILDEQ
jgi:hypothetical protein